MLQLTKDKSIIIKGIAISMMLILHLFSGTRTELCTNLIYIGKTPFALWLSHACNPVSFFMLLSGYGLACKYEKKRLNPKDQAYHILYLYLHYWIVLALFLSIGHYLVPNSYPGSISQLINNMLGWKSTYCGVMWFLFPYSLISLASLFIMRIIDKIGVMWSIVITATIYLLTCYLISRHGTLFFTNMLVYQPLLFFNLLFDFTMGIALRRTAINLTWNGPKWIIIILIILCIITQCIVDFDGSYMIYTPLMVILLGNIHYPKWAKAILSELGKKSMPIWMIHSWLSFTLFQSQIYSLKYPLFIFMGLIAISYLLSIPVMWIADKIYSLLPSPRGSKSI